MEWADWRRYSRLRGASHELLTSRLLASSTPSPTAAVREQADTIIATIRRDWSNRARSGFIFASRSELTVRFCPHAGRNGALKTRELYDRIIPVLEVSNDARLIKKTGKAEVFAFRAEDR